MLVAADLRGIASHGTARLPQYVRLIEAGVVEPAARPRRERGRTAISLFDAGNGWGHHAGRVAMDDAIVRCRETGVAAAVVRNSNHYGIAGWYAMRAADRGLIGVSMTNSSPLVAPTRGRLPMLGTNPIAVAVPAGRHGKLVLDMATSTVPRGRIEPVCFRRFLRRRSCRGNQTVCRALESAMSGQAAPSAASANNASSSEACRRSDWAVQAASQASACAGVR